MSFEGAQNNNHIKATANTYMNKVYDATYPARAGEPQGSGSERLDTIMACMAGLSHIYKAEGRDSKFAPMARSCARRYASEGVYNCLTDMAQESGKSVADIFKAAVSSQLFTLNGEFVGTLEFAQRQNFARADCSKKNAYEHVKFLLDTAEEMSCRPEFPKFDMGAPELGVLIEKLFEIPSQERGEKEINLMHLLKSHYVKQAGSSVAVSWLPPLPEKVGEKRKVLGAESLNRAHE